MGVRVAAMAAAMILLTGCHSAFIDATVANRSAAPVTLVEIDYPSASFGTDTLAPGQEYHYRFKVQGQGPTKLLWTDEQHHDHTATGPSLAEHDEGHLQVAITAGEPEWKLTLTNRPAK
jgi:hypothetical protein